MTTLPKPPKEVPVDRDLSKLAPAFRKKIELLLERMRVLGHDAMVFEAFRSDERAAYLYGFGRSYDDGRGVVTKAKDGRKTFHRYGLAVDIISRSMEWDAPKAFWDDLRKEATALGLRSGDDWDRDGIPVEQDPDEHTSDRPHVQWWVEGMLVTPSDHAWEVLSTQGALAVWQSVRAA